MITTDLNPELEKYLLEQEERRKAMSSPDYQAQRSAIRTQEFDASRAPQEIASYAKAFSQLGTLGGKTADTSSLQENANAINKQQGAQLQQDAMDQEARDRDSGLRMKTLEYLQGRSDRTADRQRQEESAQLADRRARDLAKMQSDRAYGLASFNAKNQMEAEERRAARDMQMAGLKGDQELKMAEAKARIPDKAIQKSNQEGDYRYISLKNNSEKLKDLVNRHGTFAATGPQGAEMDSLIYQMAVDYAKLVDPDSVAKEGEVEAAKKYMLPFRQSLTDQLFTKNDTAIKQIENYQSGLDERLAARKAAQSGDLQARTYKPQGEKPEGGTAFAAGRLGNVKLPPGTGKVKVISAEGEVGYLSEDKVEEALKRGARRAD